MSVNKKLLLIKAHYFLYNAGTAPIVPFITVYARQLGFSSVIVGLIFTIMNIACLLIRPTIGAIADKYKCQKLIFITAQFFTAITLLLVYFVPSLPINDRARFSCGNQLSVFDTCLIPGSAKEEFNTNVQCELHCPLAYDHWNKICNSYNITDNCMEDSNMLRLNSSKIIAKKNCFNFEVAPKFLCSNISSGVVSFCEVNNCNSSEINAVFRSKAIEDEDVVKHYQFWIFVLLLVISAIGQRIVINLADTICFELLENKPHKYGQQRAFGALGWGLFSILAGFMIDTFSKDGQRDYASTFYLGFAILLINLIIGSRINFAETASSQQILKDVGKLFLNKRVVIFFAWCIILGMSTSLIWSFLLWLIEDIAATYDSNSKSWISSLEGLINTIRCLGGELPLFFLSGWIIKKLGHVNTMTFILAVNGIKFVLYSYLINPWYILPIEILNGLTFSLGYATMTYHARIISPPGTATTVQGLTGAVFQGIGISLGNIVGGILFESYGGAATFRAFGIASFAACIFHAIIQFLFERKTPDQGTAEYASPSNAVHEDEELKEAL